MSLSVATCVSWASTLFQATQAARKKHLPIIVALCLTSYVSMQFGEVKEQMRMTDQCPRITAYDWDVILTSARERQQLPTNSATDKLITDYFKLRSEVWDCGFKTADTTKGRP